MTISSISSIYIATITASNLKVALGGLVSFVNFREPENNPFGSTINFKKKKKILPKILNIFSLLQISSLNNKHLLNLCW